MERVCIWCNRGGGVGRGTLLVALPGEGESVGAWTKDEGEGLGLDWDWVVGLCKLDRAGNWDRDLARDWASNGAWDEAGDWVGDEGIEEEAVARTSTT
ncbi:hypothetical protein SLA2020_111640 [Shorea laevis]